MKGRSYKNDCTVRLSDLRYVRLLHYNFKGQVKLGELICNKSVSDDLVEIFRELFEHHYPIESVLLVDNFEANDEMSMRANNSSCFNYRVVKGSSKLSLHSQGRAIDINPLYNPCVRLRTHTVQPATGRRYATGKIISPIRFLPRTSVINCLSSMVFVGVAIGKQSKTTNILKDDHVCCVTCRLSISYIRASKTGSFSS